MSRKSKVIRALCSLCMGLLCCTFVYPLLYMLINSLKSKSAYYTDKFSIPGISELQFRNYLNMISNFKILNLFKNTLIIVVSSIVVIIALAVLASYAIAKIRFRFRMMIYIVIVCTMFMPIQVTLIPMYIMFARMGLINNFLSVILTNIASALPQTVMMMVAFFRGIPDELLEAAEIDGAGFFQKIWDIVVPLGKPAIVINIIMNSIVMWNDLLAPMIFLQRTEKKTIMPALAAIMQTYSSDPPYQLAGLLLATIPALFLYIVLQKHIVNGIITGALK